MTIKDALTVARLNAILARTTTNAGERAAAEHHVAQIVARTQVANALSAKLSNAYGIGVTMPAGRLNVTV